MALAFCLGVPVVYSMEQVIETFQQGAVALKWRIVNDGVMGGVSTSSLERLDAETVRFSGSLSLENNGGFASFRSFGPFPPIDGASAILIRVRGDGRTYQLRLRMSDDWRAPQYSATFKTSPGAWQTHVLPLSTFRAGWRGREVPNAPDLQAGRVRSVGILLGDKQPGAFVLDIDWIRADGA